MKHRYISLTAFTLLVAFMASCVDKNQIVDKKRIAPGDYRQFQGTPAWPLAKAAWEEDMDRMRDILDRSPELMEVKDSLYGNTVLMMAITHQQYKPFMELLERGADVNYHNKLNGFSPILEASSYKDNKSIFVEKLLEHGADINDRRELSFAENGERGSTPLIYAATCGNMSIVEYLISRNAEINAADEYNHDTALGAAITTCHYDVAYYLSTHGADYEIPVFYACDKKGNMTVPAYIGKVLRLNTPDFFSRSFRDKRKVIEFLRQRGYDYDTVPIPEDVEKRIRKRYPLLWKIYLKYY